MTMEQRFDLLMNPPKILKCRMIVMALHSIANPAVTLDRFPETHGHVRDLMRSTLKHIDPQYEKALAALNSIAHPVVEEN